MGGFPSKEKSKHCERYVRSLTEKIRMLQGEINEMVCEREKETRTYEGDLMVFAFKEAEWKQERRRLKEEVKRLRKMVEEKEERIKGMEDGMVVVAAAEKGGGYQKDWQMFGSTAGVLVEQMREERAWRDEAVEKWKRLYLAIKAELDDLIRRTDRGDGVYGRSEEEEMMEELRNEIKAKEETINDLKAKIASIEQEGYKKEREVDILRQSLRIMSSKRITSHLTKKLSPT